MNTDSKTALSLPSSPLRRRAGAALVIILCCLVLITGIIVAFFASVSTELSAAKGYANGVTTKELSDSALATVMGAIKTATSGTIQGASWASQPGMIRTFDIDLNSTNSSYTQGLAYYKLYSSGTMVVTKEKMPYKPGDDIDTQWNTKPSLFTDLNAPIVSGTNLIYPIFDPSLDGLIDGYHLDPGRPGYSASGSQGPTNDPVPMPVQWLYVLRNGDLAAPTGGGTTATFSSNSSPSQSNPIVGRIAFWTDDETCKLNINTASEPTPWDTPRMVSANPPSTQPLDEIGNAFYQPYEYEFQRFPGHPAMTALSPVLFPGNALSDLTLAQKTAIYNLVPRVQQGGSKSATAQATTGAQIVLSGTGQGWGYYTANNYVTMDNDRLFASTDELLFSATNRSTYNSLNAGAIPMLASGTLAKLGAFLTANSRAPEVNLWGGPRVSMWPVSSVADSGHRTSYDNAVAFCCTIGTNGRIFYFQRNASGNTTGPNSTTDDYQNIPRNQALFSYLQGLLKQDVPGFGGKFSDKWTSGGSNDCDQVLTEIFDYIRCTNLHDSHVNTPYSTNGQVAPIQITTDTKHMGFGRFYTISQVGIMFICRYDYNQITLLPDFHDAGFIFRNDDCRAWEENFYHKVGRLPVGNEVINGYTSATTGTIAPFLDPANPTYSQYINTKVIQAALLIEPYCPSVGYYGIWNDSYYSVTLSNFGVAVGGTSATPTGNVFNPLSNGVTPTNIKYYATNLMSAYHGRVWGGGVGARQVLGGWGGSYPFLSGNIFVSATAGAFMNLDSGGTAKIQIFSGPDTTGISNGQQFAVVPANPVQTINVQMPAMTMPIPALVTSHNSSVRNWAGTISPGDRNPTVQPTPPATPIPLPATRWVYGDPANWWFFNDWLDYEHVWVDQSITKDSTCHFDPDMGVGPTHCFGRLHATGPGGPYLPAKDYTAGWRRWTSDTTTEGWQVGCLFREEDSVRTVVPKHGDIRLIAAMPNVPATVWVEAEKYNYHQSGYHLVHLFSETVGPQCYFNFANEPGASNYVTVTGGESSPNRSAGDHQLVNYGYHYSKLPETVADAGKTYNQFNDWDNGMAQYRDGPYINKPDEGNIAYNTNETGNNNLPYYSWNFTTPTGVMFSANRIIPSSMMLGSLPTGVMRWSDSGTQHAWETLLFHPPTDRNGNLPGTFASDQQVAGVHPGWWKPRDHLIADLFWMPVISPYPISEPFSTAGKINMNFPIVPFNYIHRETGMYGVLKSERPLLISSQGIYASSSGSNMSIGTIGKLWDHDVGNPAQIPSSSCQDTNVLAAWNTLVSGASPLRKPIDASQVVQQMNDSVFNDPTSPTIFKSPSQICELHLVRKGESTAQYQGNNIWPNNLATGDNTRERPYANLYGRLTTKSNTYRVHMRVQALQQAIPPGADASRWAKWNENTDRVLGEYRGSALIERYIDPADPTLTNFNEAYSGSPQFDANGNVTQTGSLDPFYRFRVLSIKRLSP